MKRYKLKLTSLKFISPVDVPAQETATPLLLKRAGVSKATARVVKVDDEMGLVFCWALTTKAAGSEYFDLHGDNIVEDDLIKVCAEFMEGARAVDEMHNGEQSGQVIFGMPMTAEVAKAFGLETDTEGFMVAIKPAPDVFAKFKSGEYAGVSIEGTGVREEVEKAQWTTAYINDLPDSAFLHIESGGKKDEDGKTTPRSLRHFPYKDASGAIDLLHVRNAVAQAPKSTLPKDVIARVQAKGRKILDAQGAEKHAPEAYAKQAALTTPVSGHSHLLCGVDEMISGMTGGASMSGDGSSYSRWHSHPWIKAEDGTITIGEQEGHTHEIAASSSSAPAPAPVAMRAPAAGKSTTAQAAPMVKATTDKPAQEQPQMTDLATLKKHLAIALTLPEAQRAHAATLDDVERAEFLAKTAADREAIVKAAQDADPVLYTRTDGTAIRKSQGQLFADVAKQADQAMALAAGEVSKRQDVELAKRADVELSHFTKTAGPKVALLKAVDGITDEKVRAEVHEMLAAANAACKELGKPQGANPGSDPEEGAVGKRAELRRAVEDFAKAHGGLKYETAFVQAIAADPKIRGLYEDVQSAG